MIQFEYWEYQLNTLITLLMGILLGIIIRAYINKNDK